MGALAAAPFDIGGHLLYATTSIGIAVFPQDAADAPSLQRQKQDAEHAA